MNDRSIPAPIAEPAPVNLAVVAHRVVQAGLALGLLWKWKFFTASAKAYAAIPLQDEFFPEFFRSTPVLVVTFIATVAAIGLNFITANRRLQIACSTITLAGATVLCLHQGSYNDMTFVTTWWTSVWALWFVVHLSDPDRPALLRRAAFLSRLIISVILL